MGAITTSSEDSKHSSSGPNRHRATTVSDSHNSAVGPQESMSLSRHGTLLSPSACATPLKRTVELKSLLGNANSRLPPGAFLSQQPYGQEPTAFEQAKPRARVEIDIMLQSNTCVEGGIFKGFIKLRIRPRMSKEPAVFISDGKLRIIGFETVAGDPHEFFQHATALSSIVTSPPRIYDSSPDSEGFHTAQEGVHRLDFEMQLPMGADRRPKGPFYGPSGVAVRYIALVSVKVKDEFNKRSIAHFYRDCQIWPRLNPSVILAPAEQPIQVTTSKSLFMGGNGEVQLTAALHRSTFVAGSTVIVNLSVKNDTKKPLKSFTLTLYQSLVIFKRKLSRDVHSAVELDIDASQTTTTKKAVATSIVEMAQGFPRSHASNSGWWAGVPSGERLNFSHLLPIPPDALTLTRGALIEVEYTIRVGLNASFTGVCVDLPLRIVNLLSLDPPPLPTCDIYARSQSLGAETPQSASSNPNDQDCDSSDTSNGDENDGVFQTSCPEDAHDEFQLGNLSMCDDAEDLVRHAMVSAQIHQTTEQAAEEPSEPETPEPSSSTEPDPHSDPASGPISRPSRPRAQSSFPLRVQKKLELAATARQSSSPACEQETPALAAEAPQDAIEGLSLAAGPAISNNSEYQVASSAFLDDYYFDSGAAPQSEDSESPRPVAGSRVLPTPPSSAGLPSRETPPDLSTLGIATFTTADKQAAELSDRACSVEQIKEQLKPRRPPIVSGMSSAGSVKDKIRELEERVRAAEGY